MASSVVVRGKRIYRPGVYSEAPDTRSGAGVELSTGNVALVGELDFLQAATPAWFSRESALAALTDDPELALLGRLAFRPANDPAVPGGAQQLGVVGVKPTTQAKVDLLDVGANDVLQLRSRLWGPKGNQVSYQVTVNAADANARDIVLTRGELTESYSNLQSGALAQLWYGGSDLTRTTITTTALSLIWAWEKDLTFPTGSPNNLAWEPTELVISNRALSVSMANGGAGASSANVTVTVVGLDDEGDAATEVCTAASGGTVFDKASTATKWSRIDSVTIATADTSYNGTVTVSSRAFDLDMTQFETLGQVLSFIEASAAQGFRAVSLLPVTGSVPASPDASDDAKAGGVNAISGANALGTGNKVSLRADLWAIASALGNSAMVEVEVKGGGDLPPAAAQGKLLGGSAPAADLTHWQAALRALEGQDVQYVVVLTDDVDVHGLLRDHCNQAALRGGERACFVGAAANTSLSDLRDDYAAVLSTQYVTLVGQEVQVVDPIGRRRWLAPRYLAVMLAGAAAGTPPGTPLTNKALDVLDVRGAWDADQEADDAIRAGVCQLHRARAGVVVTRSVTTWLRDDNPFMTEFSAWESLQTSARDMRLAFPNQIGSATRAQDAALARAAVESRLDDQVRRGIIKAWQAGSVEVLDRGDWLDLAYRVAPTEPRNFITIRPYAQR